MAVSAIDQFGNFLFDLPLATSTTAQSVATLIANAGQKLPPNIYGYSLTNCDPTNAVYIGFTNAVSATRYYRSLAAAGGSHQITASVGVLDKLYIVAAAGTPSVLLVLFG